MTTETNQIVPPFDFGPALRYGLDERMSLCVDRVRNRLLAQGAWDMFGVPPVPDVEVSEVELRQLETHLGISLPCEYRGFLQRWRYLVMGDGLRVWGLDHQGVSIGWPWISHQHRTGVRYLVFADYWNYADGDQLLFEIDDPESAVIAYLHEHGPLYEVFAPSFSLALWRMVHEWATGDQRVI